jgi:hypothetical protein
MIVLMTVVAGGSMALGAYASSVVQQQNVGQHASQYGVSTSSVANWPSAPTVEPGGVPASVSACSASGIGFTPGGSYESVYVGLNGTSPVCKTNDYAEELSFQGASSMTTETDTFTVYATWVNTGGTSLSAVDPFGVAVTGGANSGGQGIVLYLDFGATPPQSIGSLSVVVT